MNKISRTNEPKFFVFILEILSLLLLISVIFTFQSAKREKSKLYDIQIEASLRSKVAMEEIKNYKIDNDFKFEKEDKYKSGMIGLYYSSFTTTSGDPKAKRTACNPNFAALFIKLFNDCGLKPGDEIAICESGSFPTLNIQALIASEEYGLKPVIMSTVGSSSYGANDKSFTYFDMAEYLYDKGLVKTRIDYVSFGGAKDDGSEFEEEITNPILDRITESGIPLLKEPDFNKNCIMRMDLIKEKCPNLKLFLNIGGNLVSMGRDTASAVYYRGIVKPSEIRLSVSQDSPDLGLLDRYLLKGTTVIQMLNIKGIASDYGLPYDPDSIPQIGDGDVYYETAYNKTIPIIALSITGLLAITYVFYKIKYLKETS